MMLRARVALRLTMALGLMVAASCREKPIHDVARGTRPLSDAVPAASSGPPPRTSGADIGLPVYPGAVVDESSVQRVDMGGYYQLHSSFDSTASAEKVIAFYRATLKALAPTAEALVETSTSGKTTFLLKRNAKRVSLVAIEPTEGAAGSEIHLTDTGEKTGGGVH